MFPNERARKILSNIGWMTFDKIFILLLNLLITVKIANSYGAKEYGVYQYAVSIVAIFEILIKFADGRIVKKQYLSHNSETVVKTATVARLIFSGISALIGLIYILLNNRELKFKLIFAILLLNGIATNLRFGMTNRFEYLLKSKKVVIAADLSLIISSILQLVAVRVGYTIISIALIALVASIINYLVVFIQYKIEFKYESHSGVIDRSLLWIIIKESLPLAIAASCSTIYSRCDSVMIGNMLSANDVGVYAIAVKLISIVQIAIHPITESVYPRLVQLYNTNKKAYENFYIKVSSCLTWLYIVGVILSFYILPFAFRLLDSEYAPAFSIYKIYVLGSFFLYNAALSTGHFAMINRGKILTFIQGISMITNIFLNIVLINKFGLYGAATATAITNFMSTMVAYALLKRDGRQVFIWQIKALNPLRIFNVKN